VPIKSVKEPKPTVYPVVDPELLEIVRGIYAKWTGQEFAAAVAEIRRDIEAGRFSPKQ
jgi:hypothetical protein